MIPYPVSFTLTSTGRLDLLETTINSFMEHNTYPIVEYIMIEDSGDRDVFRLLQERYGHQFKILFNFPKIGQSASVDRLFRKVKTEHVFHCEDDWVFDRPGFIEESLQILQSCKEVHQVWIRHTDDTPHKYDINQRLVKSLWADGPVTREFKVALPEAYFMPEWEEWIGYCWAPGLRRKSDHWKFFPDGVAGIQDEKLCNNIAKAQGYRAVSLANTAMRHIGYGRHSDGYKQ